jgi:hypothetical protein
MALGVISEGIRGFKSHPSHQLSYFSQVSHEKTYLLPSSFNKGQGDHVKTTATNPTALYRSTNSVKNVAKSLHVSPIGEPLAELLKVLKHP